MARYDCRCIPKFINDYAGNDLRVAPFLPTLFSGYKVWPNGGRTAQVSLEFTGQVVEHELLNMNLQVTGYMNLQARLLNMNLVACPLFHRYFDSTTSTPNLQIIQSFILLENTQLEI